MMKPEPAPIVCSLRLPNRPTELAAERRVAQFRRQFTQRFAARDTVSVTAMFT